MAPNILGEYPPTSWTLLDKDVIGINEPNTYTAAQEMDLVSFQGNRFSVYGFRSILLECSVYYEEFGAWNRGEFSSICDVVLASDEAGLFTFPTDILCGMTFPLWYGRTPETSTRFKVTQFRKFDHINGNLTFPYIVFYQPGKIGVTPPGPGNYCNFYAELNVYLIK